MIAVQARYNCLKVYDGIYTRDSGRSFGRAPNRRLKKCRVCMSPSARPSPLSKDNAIRLSSAPKSHDLYPLVQDHTSASCMRSSLGWRLPYVASQPFFQRWAILPKLTHKRPAITSPPTSANVKRMRAGPEKAFQMFKSAAALAGFGLVFCRLQVADISSKKRGTSS